ncbi:MAG: hypothetical protein ACYC9W_09615 [Candidatus Limnocylindria bacterium]
MTTPFSLRMDDATREELLAHAERSDTSSSKLANRYVKEGLRMDKHPAIAFKTTPRGRRTILASRPGLQVIDIIGTWQAERQSVAAAARYFHIGEDDVHAVLRYYAEYKDEIDQDLRAHLDAQENYKRVLGQREVRTRRRVANA